MKNYLDKIKDFDEVDIEDALDEYFRCHNNLENIQIEIFLMR